MAEPGEKAEDQGAEPKKQQKEDSYDEMKERMLRLAAEFDNYKKRSTAELQRSKQEAKAEIVRSILGVLDEFELTLMAASNSSDKKLSKGIEMLYANLMDSLKKDGLSEIKAEGSYDPYSHEIMQTRESEQKEGSILEVVRKGYQIGGIMLRPASVIVASKPRDNHEESPAKSSE